jgi:CNT family concentrative nucleoside transporter
MEILSSILFGIMGISALVAIAAAFSTNRTEIKWPQIATGIGLQIIFAIFVILTPWGTLFFNWIGSFFVKVISFTYEGSAFVFGVLADQGKFGSAFSGMAGAGFIFAFQVLPTIIFFSALMSVLYHIGVMQKNSSRNCLDNGKTIKNKRGGVHICGCKCFCGGKRKRHWLYAHMLTL